ncbi:MAG: glycosyltransferase family 39 protein [Candidatus Rokubacteria bacterium]|nr:glycosyltransferase family 39 protein [Candidatus Rokubacteria bacterium]
MTAAVRGPLGLFLLALAIRLGALVVAANTGTFPDFWEPDVLARNLLAGHGYVYPELGTWYRAYMEPLYPGLVAAVYLVTGFSVWALGLVQCVLGALLAPVVHALTRRTFGGAAAAAAGVLVAVHPGLAGYGVKFHPLVLDSLLLALVGLALVALLQTPSARGGLVFGGALGLCVLSRPTVLGFVALVVAGAMLARRRQGLPRALAIGIVTAAVVVAPWVVRNYRALDAFVLTRTNVGYVFWLGNHPGTTGGAGDPSDPQGNQSLFALAPPALYARVTAAGEIEQNRILMAEALAYVRAEPAAFVGRYVRKLAYFWTFPPYGGKRYAGWQVTVYLAFYAALALAALAGLWRAWRHPVPGQGPGLAVAVLLPVTVAATQALFYIEGRHRLAIEALLAVPAGYAVAALRERFRPRP